MAEPHDLTQRLRSGALILSTFVKTPHPSIIEVLASAGFDVLCLDAEHAPFDRRDLDLTLLAGGACGQPILVRPASSQPEAILNALDLGAVGIVAPHVATPQAAEALVRSCRYQTGGRGYSASTRAGDYGARSMAQHIATSNRDTAIIAQIEDAEAIGAIDAIAAVEGLDACFIGRADLAVSLGATALDAALVIEAVDHVIAACQARGRVIGMFVANAQDVPSWHARGVSFFIIGSEQALLGAAARQAVIAARGVS